MSNIRNGETIEGYTPSAVPRESPIYERSDGKQRIVVSAWVDADIAYALDALAENDGVTRSTIVRDAVEGLVNRRTVKTRRGRVPRAGKARVRSHLSIA